VGGRRDLDASAVHSTTFTMEWPPKSGASEGVPRDRTARGWFPLDVAAQKILSGQRPLIEELPKVVEGAAPVS
jgi:predicted NUDIX family NTP pyrophosphohydrolase